jgi:carbon monoxide dehydrogenase subunit G
VLKLTFRIAKPADFVFDYLTDMEKFVSVHPVITQMDTIGSDRYLVHETLKLGFIPFSFTYPVTIEGNWRDKVVIIRATVMKLTKIEMTFVIQATNGATVVEESILFKSPLPLVFIMQKVFKKQHEQLFKKMALK